MRRHADMLDQCSCRVGLNPTPEGAGAPPRRPHLSAPQASWVFTCIQFRPSYVGNLMFVFSPMNRTLRGDVEEIIHFHYSVVSHHIHAYELMNAVRMLFQIQSHERRPQVLGCNDIQAVHLGRECRHQ